MALKTHGSSSHSDGQPRVIKKYPNRRLYDTATSAYITLADIRQMVLDHTPFVVRDAKTHEDLTRSILLQIILEEETGGVPMFSNEMLAQMIRFYHAAMQPVVGSLFEQNVRAVLDFQRRMAEQGVALGSVASDPARMSSELWRQFMQLQAPAMQSMMVNFLEQSSKMFAEMQERMQATTRALFPGAPAPSSRGDRT
ncbi:MAG: polyhydroxyalkanoate synthesis repressor PhaR [Casimicrobiaceae bacterium]|nr:polyhydroxyalkanoate synthesis repressor PhaR [Casimicrobiaceae bacterium]